MIAPYVGHGQAGAGRDFFTKGSTLYTCPSDIFPRPAGWVKRTYSVCRAGCRGLDSLCGTVTNAKIEAPGTTINLLEAPGIFNVTNFAWGSDSDNVPDMFYGDGRGYPNNYLPPYPGTKPEHSGDWMWLFADGHVKRMPWQATIGKGTPQRPEGYWVLNKAGQ